MTNCCAFDCSYCVNRKSNDIPRATFTPRELAELTVEFYRRNYIEGLFLSSAVLGTPDYTTERMLAALRLLRGEYRFGGYIHAKAIPGTSPELLQQLGYLADRLSVNVELPSEHSLNLLAPDKGRHSIFRPMKQIAVSGAASREELTLYRHAPKFAPAGQSTQMIVGASPETDYHILKLTEGMYQKYGLKRVCYSAYIPVAEDTRLPALDTKPPLLREHRLYQADWLLRFYQFEADEILDKFCEQVEVDGVLRDKYVRQTRREIDEGTVREVYEDGFPEPKSKPFTYVDDEYAERAIRCSRTYYEYAKDICENYRMDLRRYKLIRERKQYIGISNREAYQAMCEDLAFAQQSLKTVLNDYADLFRKRFSEGLSIRKVADAMQQNRGVIERRLAALYRAFAQLL